MSFAILDAQDGKIASGMEIYRLGLEHPVLTGFKQHDKIKVKAVRFDIIPAGIHSGLEAMDRAR